MLDLLLSFDAIVVLGILVLILGLYFVWMQLVKQQQQIYDIRQETIRLKNFIQLQMEAESNTSVSEAESDDEEDDEEDEVEQVYPFETPTLFIKTNSAFSEMVAPKPKLEEVEPEGRNGKLEPEGRNGKLEPEGRNGKLEPEGRRNGKLSDEVVKVPKPEGESEDSESEDEVSSTTSSEDKPVEKKNEPPKIKKVSALEMLKAKTATSKA